MHACLVLEVELCGNLWQPVVSCGNLWYTQVDEDVAHGLAGIRRLVQTLQDQVDSSSTTPAADDASLPSSSRKVSSHSQAFVLETIQRISREAVAARAAWAVANLVANNKESQDAVR